ncbi:MAG: alpha/beta hydrolase [Actinobacteria bacterium]|nr:MAG: alpha/beta hydrolase [Actinomycetota bacterium]
MPIEPVTLSTADGLVLEGEIDLPDRAWSAAVLAHPHPEFGGTMRSIVTAAMFGALPQAGVACLRFNFRGVGGSAGTHGGGQDERADLVAAIDVLAPITEGLPLALAGWSFGADTSLTVADERLDGWLAVAPPLRTAAVADMVAPADPRPKLVIVPEHDQFRPPESAAPILEGWKNTRVEILPGGDHYLVGRADQLMAVSLDWLRELSPRSA